MSEDVVVTEQVAYPSGPRRVASDIAHPSSGAPWPAIILIHEISGTGDHYRDVTRRFAHEGYLAICPDLYSNDDVYKSLEPHAVHAMGRVRHADDLDAAIAALSLPEHDAQELKRAALWDKQRDISTYVPDLLAAIGYLRSRTDVRGDAIGAVGYCWGGGLLGQFLTAGADLSAATIYYGEAPAYDQLGNVRCPVEGHYGTADTVVGYTWAPDLQNAMKAAGKHFNYYIYEEAPHAFFNDTGPRYREQAARQAWERTLAFFEQHLKRATVGAG